MKDKKYEVAEEGMNAKDLFEVYKIRKKNCIIDDTPWIGDIVRVYNSLSNDEKERFDTFLKIYKGITMETINLTDQEIQSLIDARKVCKDLKKWYTMSRLDDILEEIYPGWISHLDEGC